MVDMGEVAEIFYNQLEILKEKRREELFRNWDLLFHFREEKNYLEKKKAVRAFSKEEARRLEELKEVLLPPLEMMFPGF